MHRVIVLLLIGIASYCFSAPILADNLGVYGKVWPIQEVNMKAVMVTQASKVDWSKVGNQLVHKAVSWGARLPNLAVPTARRVYTNYVDPSVTLTHDIYVGKALLYPKGTTINPLHYVKPATNMLFFNGHNPAQTQFALRALKAHPYRLMLVMTEGDPQRLGKRIHHQIYYANSHILARFHIREVPTLLGVGSGVHQDRLAVTTFDAPYHVSVLETCWYGCAQQERG